MSATSSGPSYWWDNCGGSAGSGSIVSCQVCVKPSRS